MAQYPVQSRLLKPPAGPKASVGNGASRKNAGCSALKDSVAQIFFAYEGHFWVMGKLLISIWERKEAETALIWRYASQAGRKHTDGDGLMRQYAGSNWNGSPVWGQGRNTWVKIVVE
jgi:hypothetical protein